MKTVGNWSTIALLAMSSLWLVSCGNDDVDLVDPGLKTLELISGCDSEIPVLSRNWSIESVKDMETGQYFLDKDDNPLALDGNGKVEALNGWLAISRDDDNKFVVSLKENFDKSHVRKISICINEAGKRDYVTITQRAGSEYKLVKAEYEEIEREVYKSDKECTKLTLKNESSEEYFQSVKGVFKNVLERSTFESEDYGAFKWIPEEGVDARTPDLKMDGYIIRTNSCTYQRGTTANFYYTGDGKILIRPYSTLYVKGEVTYCKRVCNYIFTIQNEVTGFEFEVKGVWTHVTPFVTTTILFDKDPDTE